MDGRGGEGGTKRPTSPLPAKKGKQVVEEPPDEELLRLDENQPRIKQKLTTETETMQNIEEMTAKLKEKNLFIALAGEGNSRPTPDLVSVSDLTTWPVRFGALMLSR